MVQHNKTKYIPASEPRVSIKYTPANITNPSPKLEKPTSSPPSINTPSPSTNVQTQQSKKYKDTFASRIIKAMHKKPKKGDKYTSIRRRRLGISARDNHFTRSRLQGFLAQSVVQVENEGCQQHIAKHVYHHDTGTKQTIDTFLAGEDGNIWKQSLSKEIGKLAQGVDQNRKNKNMSKERTQYFLSHAPMCQQMI